MLSERSMTVIESAGYTPFEQLQSKGNVGPWSDLYALGAALEKILTGEAPPKAMDRMRNDPRLPLANSTDLEALYSTAFLASIDKALAVEENQRWQSAEEWLWILRGEIVAKPVATAPKRKQETISARSAEASKPATGSDKKHNFIPWIVGVCVVLGLIAVANLTGEKEASPSPTSVEEATLQQERAKAEAAAAQAREAEQRAAQAEREKEEIIAQARAKEEAETREAERQRAARTAEEEQALIAQARAKEQAAAKAEEAKRLHAGGDAGKERDFEIAPGLTITMCWIPPGEFMMGRAEGEGGRGKDETQHPVTLSQGFWLAKTEVTQAQWRAVMGSNPSHFKGDDLPVESVSWNAIAGPGGFIDKLNKIATADGGRFKLPTEAQWEYACLAGTVGPYDGGLDQMAWYRENSGNRTHTVGQKKANAWGLHDMHGNVWEWCADWNRAYPEGAVRDPSGPDSGSARVRRGGSWGSDAYYCHVAHRSSYHPAMSYDDIGFRIARSSAPQSGMPSEPKTSEDISPNASHTTPGGRKNSSGKPTVCLQTSEGRIVLELNAEKAPISVENFLGYVKTKHYDGTVFHRVIDGFMIQGGGFAVTDGKLVEKSTGKGIKNEGQNGLKNDRGTIAMARTNDPDSATAQFFINVVDNAMLNYPSNGGYAVFGKVIEGMDVVDKIKAVKTGVTKLSMHHPATGEILEIPSQDVPKNIVVIKSATIIE
jgi:formylglycine-generating enzyme required for sulfatase activity/cyclophilin family peptidyl-prolyl cis-trans isomerase